MKIFKQADLSRNLIEDKRVAVLGYGNQGHAHALNLRDEGIDAIVGCRERSEGWKRAEGDAFTPFSICEATRVADFVVILLPDEVQGEVFESEIRKNLKNDATLVFAHGFAITFKEINPPPNNDVVLVAPKGQGDYLRRLYKQNAGLPCLIAVHADHSGYALEKALSYAASLGCLRAGAIETSFKEEAVTDLFGEQAVLCGGVPELVKASFEVLVDNGYNPEVAYIECLHELKIITDLMHKGGLAYMRKLISTTAAWGSYQSGKRLISSELRKALVDVLEEVENGAFARKWMAEARSGSKKLKKLINEEANHGIERAGKDVRKLMPDLMSKDH